MQVLFVLTDHLTGMMPDVGVLAGLQHRDGILTQTKRPYCCRLSACLPQIVLVFGSKCPAASVRTAWHLINNTTNYVDIMQNRMKQCCQEDLLKLHIAWYLKSVNNSALRSCGNLKHCLVQRIHLLISEDMTLCEATVLKLFCL